MQGRLLSPVDGTIQRFPGDRWRDELALAAAVGLDAVEWIVDDAEGNPMATNEGGLEVVRETERTGVDVDSICADVFMVHRLIDGQGAPQRLDELVARAGRLGLHRIVLPFVDASSLRTAGERDAAVHVLRQALPGCRRWGVELDLETDLGPGDFAELLDRIPDERVRVNYDTGNSASLGYDPVQELAAYGDRLGSVHIKDRLLHGPTVALGRGDTRFGAVFAELARLGYAGDLVLQAARGEPGGEPELAAGHLALVRSWRAGRA
jgi:L-ribulose-5-phosphate 3-epimerase